MGDSYQIRDQTRAYFATFQVVGWADIFSRKYYRDIILESFRYCRESKGLLLFAYVQPPCKPSRAPPRPRLSDSGNEDEMEQSFCKAG
jgi:hypothetical protein